MVSFGLANQPLLPQHWAVARRMVFFGWYSCKKFFYRLGNKSIEWRFLLRRFVPNTKFAVQYNKAIFSFSSFSVVVSLFLSSPFSCAPETHICDTPPSIYHNKTQFCCGCYTNAVTIHTCCHKNAGTHHTCCTHHNAPSLGKRHNIILRDWQV